MTSSRILEIAKRLEAASQGEWRVTVPCYRRGHTYVYADKSCVANASGPNKTQNADLIANAPADLRHLIDENARLRAERDELFVLIRRVLRLAREHRDFSVLGFEPFWKVIGGVEGLPSAPVTGPSEGA